MSIRSFNEQKTKRGQLLTNTMETESNKTILGGILAPEKQNTFMVKVSHGDFYFEVTGIDNIKTLEIWQKASLTYLKERVGKTNEEAQELTTQIVADVVKQLNEVSNFAAMDEYHDLPNKQPIHASCYTMSLDEVIENLKE